MKSIQSIIDGHNPALELEVRQYIEGVVESALEDVGETADDVGEVLSTFLSEDESRQILSAIQSRRNLGRDGESYHHCPQLLHFQLAGEHRYSPNSLPDKKSCTQTLRILPAEDAYSKPKSKSQTRKEARLGRKKSGNKKKIKPSTSEIVNDDHASAWKECQESDRVWGGRGQGGRGIRLTGNNFQSIHLPSVSLSYEGNELLVDSTMDIVKGHRYGLLGRNGVGKSSLLRQLEAGAIPGLPRGMVIRMAKQHVEGKEDQTTLEALVEADDYRTALLKEQKQVEKDLDGGVNLEENANRIGEIAVELDVIDADNAENRAMEILSGLSFTRDMIHGPTINLSGGWRMRLALAQVLFAPHSDLVLLDECTNHLDLHGMAWLEKHLTKHRGNPFTGIFVSHDRSFLDAVCTDMIVMEHSRLTYHVGNYSDYQQKMQEKTSRESQLLDASERQRSKALSFVQKQQQSKKSSDPNKQRQAKMIKEKKLDRIGNYREDGKRYKLNSLKKLSEDYVRLAQKVVVKADDPIVKLRFPHPCWPPGIMDGSPLIKMEGVTFSYTDSIKPDEALLRHVTLNLTRKTKVAIVGANGCGKTTLLKLLNGEIDDESVEGTIWRHPNLRIGHITQHSVEELNEYAHLTVLQYAEENLSSGEASSSMIAKASGNVRQYLGSFGLGGSHATRPIRALSGGERMRLCFATVLASTVHVLLLDESSNHIDLETMNSLSAALRDFSGAIVMVSHNQCFLSGFCNELWSFSEGEKGKVDVSHNDTESFDELFSSYRNQILSRSSSRSVVKARQSMAKKAARQNANVSKNTALL